MKTTINCEELFEVCKMMTRAVSEIHIIFKNNEMKMVGVHLSGSFGLEYTTTLDCAFSEQIEGTLDTKKLVAALKGLKEADLVIGEDTITISGKRKSVFRYKEPFGKAPRIPPLKPFINGWKCDVALLSSTVKDLNSVVGSNRACLVFKKDCIEISCEDAGESSSTTIEAHTDSDAEITARFMVDKIIAVCEGVKGAEIFVDTNYPLFVKGRKFTAVLAPLVENN